MLKMSLLISLFIGVGCANSSYPTSAHYNGKTFFTPWVQTDKGFSDFLKWQWTRNPEKWPEWIDDNVQPEMREMKDTEVASVTFVNHASFYVRTKNYAYITDPIFSERASPVSFAGPRRVRAPGLALEQIPRLDIVLISHSHYDHLDKNSVKMLVKKFDPLFLVPLGNKKLLESFGVEKVIEMDWWEVYDKVPELKITLVPAQHWSARGLFDRNETLWGGFVTEDTQGFKVYFAGDTGYGPHFQEIQKRWQSFHLALLPIGAYEPRWFMKEQHMNPEDAVLAHKDLRADLSLGSHFGTFPLTDEGVDRPKEELQATLQKSGVAGESFQALQNGKTLFIGGEKLNSKKLLSK